MHNQTMAVAGYQHGDDKTDKSVLSKTRFNFIQLQALVAIVLSYQVLFSRDTQIADHAQLTVVLGLMLTCAAIMVMPDRWIAATWFPGALALADTGIVTLLIALSGNVSSDLYLAYFVILLIATMTRTPRQMFLFFSIVCLLYGFVLYREMQTSGLVPEHHLLRIPLLIIMAIFYGRTVESLRSLSEYDTLTGLPNRRKLLSIMADVIARASKAHEKVAVLFLNLDGFKLINDTLGRRIGDHLLSLVASRLTTGPAKNYTIGREGGDEFTILVDHVISPQECATLAEEILRIMESPFALANREIFMTTSIGIALFPDDGDEADVLVKNADAAMSRAKESGKNTYQFFSAEINVQAYHRLEVAHSLRKALEREELRVFYQPQVDMVSNQVVGLEALIRWQHPEMGLISPGQFIGIAEETGLIGPIGQWMMRESCRQVRAWHVKGLPKVRVSVNISPRQLNQLDLVTLIGQTLKETGLDARYLELELTESLLLQDKQSTVKTLQALKALGIRLAIDDFGTGYSSLGYLKRFPIDTLKIDQTFVRDLTSSADARAIVKAIVGMAQALKLKVIAEGVETEDQIVSLREEGCDECQGFAYSRPIPADEIADLMQHWSTRMRDVGKPVRFPTRALPT